ncbi:hypothetical protein B0H14DRAFT_3085490 [Mycena olivaceomarginata]|nr:hypothetical protein B0H14DRAFT_3085490 [Mycena olivaceomarginata]
MSVEPMAKLFTPIQVGEMQLRHRVVHAPLTRFRVDPGTNVIFPFVKEYYAQRASTPGTFIISEGTLVAQKAAPYAPAESENKSSNSGTDHVRIAPPGIWSEEQITAWREVTEAVHARARSFYCQLFAMGRAATVPELADPDVEFDLVSASAIPLPGETIIPRALTVDDIEEYVELNAVDHAGFDGVEIHSGNGYLLDAFLQDTANQRTDAYGGSPENRARLLPRYPIGESKVGVQISPWSSFQDILMADPIPTFKHVVRALRGFPRIAYLHVVEPRVEGTVIVEASAHNAGHSNEFYTRVGDIIAFGRPFLANNNVESSPTSRCVWRKSIALTKGDRDTYYAPAAEGYTTYPFTSH